MVRLRADAFAKVNLSLDVLERRADGYHELLTIMHTVPLCDHVTIELGGGCERCATNLSFINTQTNIALKAARMFYEHSGIKGCGISIYIDKHIPVGAGMGGGSADAAATLLTLNAHYNEPIAESDLLKLGAKLGADVPFCMTGGAALCSGIGNVMEPLPTLPPCHLVVVKPPVSLSTPDMFARLDRSSGGKRRVRPDTAGMVQALQCGDLDGVSKRMFNAMEQVATERCGDISRIHNELVRLGADGACMTGSGSAVFGIFSDKNAATDATNRLSDNHCEAFLLSLK